LGIDMQSKVAEDAAWQTLETGRHPSVVQGAAGELGGGDGGACSVLVGRSLLTGGRAAQVRLNERISLCEGGEGISGFALAEHYVDGRPGSVRPFLEYYVMACELRIGAACRNGYGHAFAQDESYLGRRMLFLGCEITGRPDLCSRTIYETGQLRRNIDWTAYLDALVEDCLFFNIRACEVAADVLEDTRLNAARDSRWPLGHDSAALLRSYPSAPN